MAKRLKTILVITLSVVIGFISPSGISANTEDDLTSQEKDVELASSYTNEEKIPSKDTIDDLEKKIRYSVKFRGKDCYLMLVPAPEINDQIGIAAPETNDDIGIAGDEPSSSKHEIIPKLREKVLNK